MKTSVVRVVALLFNLGCLGCGLARAQTPAAPASPPGARPALPPPPVLPEHATVAQKADYERQATEYERQRWNRMLTDSTWRRTRFNTQPNALLVETVRGLPPGTALDVGAGEGRNALYLAQQGWQVTGVDVADQALAFAQARARQLGVTITTVAQDVTTYDWGRQKWDLIVISYAGGREHLAHVRQALKPGGLVVLEGFHHDAVAVYQQAHPKGGLGSGVVFDTDELKKLYASAGLKIVRYEEPLGIADFSKEELRLVKLVAQKPLR